MCGIISIHSNKKHSITSAATINKMLKSIAHRGPDDKGVFVLDQKAILGHVRLSIIDLDKGKQPMMSADGRFVLIFNGEIYNYLELKKNLEDRGETFITESDSEVLLRLLINEGAKGIKKLNGMFAFIFLDTTKNHWIAARDHFGIKPLYYALTKDRELVFASEIKAMFQHPGLKPTRNNAALQQYLAFQFCLGENTLFERIYKVPPGYYFTGTGSTLKEKICFWDTNYVVDYGQTENWYEEQLMELLQDSIKLQTRSDVPIGAYLSGGIDSSLVCALTSEHLKNPLPMFHGRFREGIEYDESRFAKKIVERNKGIYREVVPSSQDFVDELPNLIPMLDEPLAGPGLFPQYMVSKLASKSVRVVLGGQGGDEIFGGYARYLIGYLEQALKGAIYETQEEGNHLVSLDSIVPHLAILKNYKPLIAKFWKKGLFDNMDQRYFHLIDRSEGITEFLHPETLNTFNKESLFSDFRKVFNHPDTKSYINKMTHFDQKTLLPALLQVEDRVSMSVSIESRVPLLDRRIVDLVTTMPPPLKFKGGQLKYLLKNTISNILPMDIVKRKDKMGFPVPLTEWMQVPKVKNFVSDVLLSKNSLERGIFKSESLENMLKSHGVGGRQLWGALSLELWHRSYIDGI